MFEIIESEIIVESTGCQKICLKKIEQISELFKNKALVDLEQFLDELFESSEEEHPTLVEILQQEELTKTLDNCILQLPSD